MAENTTPAPGASGETPPAQPPAQLTQADIDRAAAAARREAEAKLKETQERLAALEAEKKKREEAEMTELEKIRKEREELAKTLEERENKLKTFEEKLTAHEEALKARIEKEMDGLTDEQKGIVKLLPLEKRLDAIGTYKTANPNPGNWGKSPKAGVMTLEEVQEIQKKYGPNSPEFKKAYEQYKRPAIT